MKKLILIMLCYLLFTVNATAGINVCAKATKIAQKYQKILPQQLDQVTTLTNYIVNCESKTIIHEKQLSIDINRLNRVGLTTIYKKFVASQCTVGYARFGWKITEQYYGMDGKIAFLFIVKPENCKQQ